MPVASRFLQPLFLLVCAACAEPLKLDRGPQLFLDDYLVDRLQGLRREVRPPQRMERPVLDSATFGTTQPYLTVVRDEASGRFRMWYNRGASVWHVESADGIRWEKPRAVWDIQDGFGVSVIDRGPDAASPTRFLLANWQKTRGRSGRPDDDSGMWVGFSPDGLAWSSHPGNPVLPTWPEGVDKWVATSTSDIVDVTYDPSGRRYLAAVKLPAVAADGYSTAPRAGALYRRLVGISTSKDFMHWEKPVRIFVPDEKDDGMLEFYGMGGLHRRGSLWIGFVRVLRDDLPAEPGGAADGIGYTTLAISRDGLVWHRFREPFLDRNLVPGSWDRAFAWGGHALPVGDELFVYYGGYARGHKIAPKTDRQLGLARMTRDRYMALVPVAASGTLRTRAFVLPGGRLTLNLDASRGAARVRLLDENGRALSEPVESKWMRADSVRAEPEWTAPLAGLAGRAVRLEVELRDASLFAIEFPGIEPGTDARTNMP